MKNYEVKTDIFSIEPDVWRVRIGGEILSATWRDKGAAMAGLDVECRRREIHEMSNTCWCNPEVISADGAHYGV